MNEPLSKQQYQDLGYSWETRNNTITIRIHEFEIWKVEVARDTCQEELRILEYKNLILADKKVKSENKPGTVCFWCKDEHSIFEINCPKCGKPVSRAIAIIGFLVDEVPMYTRIYAYKRSITNYALWMLPHKHKKKVLIDLTKDIKSELGIHAAQFFQEKCINP